ncbi:TauD/TfdA family dioxygenase [soil metagenome]
MQLTELRTRQLMPRFGAEIFGVDVASADAATLAAVVDTFHHHGAIVLRGQSLEPAELMRFVESFGEAEDHTTQRFTLPDWPKISQISNRVVDGKPIGSHRDGIGWHTDTSYRAEPVMCTMLYALEVPPVGADTLLADLCAAYDDLPAGRKQELDPLVLHHSYQHLMDNREFNRTVLTPELRAANPDVFHPLIRTHPADGRKALWPSTGTVVEVMGMPNPDGLALVNELIDFATQDQFVYTHKWQVGDILVWDNRCTLHTGTLFDEHKYVRHMHRCWVRGSKPV